MIFLSSLELAYVMVKHLTALPLEEEVLCLLVKKKKSSSVRRKEFEKSSVNEINGSILQWDWQVYLC